MKKIAVIGAGLSGLYLAYLLQEQYDVTIFEARDRVGGRIVTVDGFDLGPSWIWGHQHHILSLVQQLELEIFAQYTDGKALYETPQGVQAFTPPPSAASGRMSGGLTRLIEALHGALKTPVLLNECIVSLRAESNGIAVKTSEEKFQFDKVICTLPPRLAAETIVYDPPLPAEDVARMASIPTWMGHAAKCVISFEKPFWRARGLSGFCFSASGPLAEIHDACTPQSAALFGFVSATAEMADIERDVRAQLLRLFGSDAATVQSFHCIDWRKEPFTSVAADAAPRSNHPDYGLQLHHFDERLIFTGTEYAMHEGGYLEGALNAARHVYERFFRDA